MGMHADLCRPDRARRSAVVERVGVLHRRAGVRVRAIFVREEVIEHQEPPHPQLLEQRELKNVGDFDVAHVPDREAGEAPSGSPCRFQALRKA